MKACVVVSEFYPEISDKMLASCMTVLENAVTVSDINVIRVPGAFDIPFALRVLVSQAAHPINMAVALGCVIRGETYHFNVLSETCMHGILHVQLNYGVPIGNGVLTVDTKEQGLARALDKGALAAKSTLVLASIRDQITS